MADETAPLCPTHGEPMVPGDFGWLCVCSLDGPRGPVTPIPADPERDKRVDAYRDRERRRATRALDRYIESVFVETPGLGMAAPTVAGDRFVEAVGDYVLARLGERQDVVRDGDGVGYVWPSDLHQKAHYGVAGGVQGGSWVNEETGVPGSYEPDGDVRHRNPDYGVPAEPPTRRQPVTGEL